MLEVTVAVILFVVVLLMLGILEIPRTRTRRSVRRVPSRQVSEPAGKVELTERRKTRTSQHLKGEYRKRFASRLH